MSTREPDRSLGSGVYFASQDYVGYTPRLLILAVDLVVLVLALGAFTALWMGLFDGGPWVLVIVYLFLPWLYLVPLKRSKARTLGYRLAGCRLVRLDGTRPTLLALTMRLGLWGFGPSNLIFDLIWCGIDQEEQTLRDRFSGVCVVKQSAQPIGEAPIHMAYYTVMGYTFFLPRVVRPATEPARESRSVSLPDGPVIAPG